MGRANLPPPPSDPLGEALHALRLTGTLYCRTELTAPWGIDVPRLEDCSTLQIVTAGRAWLEVDGAEPLWLERGSLTLIPRGQPHRIRSAPDAPVAPLADMPVEPITERYERLRTGGPGPLTQITYGVVRFDHASARRLLEQLPAYLHLDPWDGDASQWLQSTAQLAAREASALRPGGETVLTRLTDILVIQTIREWLDNAPEARRGWLAALRDPQLGLALAGMHRAPAHPWTVETLAREANMSRSAFAARFTALVGQSAMRYLQQWRLTLARSHLIDSDAPLIDVAQRCGYGSEAAFCKAFKKAFGVPPGRMRKQAFVARQPSA